MGAWQSEHLSGANSPSWRGGAIEEREKWVQNGGRKWKRKCRKRDAHTCQQCGEVRDKYGKRLHVHHKAAFADYPELRSEETNGICLCNKCHKWIHSNEGMLVRLRWESEILTELPAEEANATD